MIRLLHIIICAQLVALLPAQAAEHLVKPGESIQAAINKASKGDLIKVMPGTYRERGILINKQLVLQGIGYPVLDGEKKYEVLTITADHVVVQGFEIIRSGYSSMDELAAVRIKQASYVGRDGIYFEFVTESTITNNKSHRNIRYGLHFMFSHQDIYTNNTFSENGAGVAVMYSRQVTMIRNHFLDNWGSAAYGILLKDISDSYAAYNEFSRNTAAIYMEGSSRLTIFANRFLQNGYGIRIQASCDNNVIRKNNFIANSFDIATNGSLVLNSFNENYWDKYEGYDLNRDGIGDVPYRPLSLFALIVERNNSAMMLFRSPMVGLLEKAEKIMPGITPEKLKDDQPSMKPFPL